MHGRGRREWHMPQVYLPGMDAFKGEGRIVIDLQNPKSITVMKTDQYVSLYVGCAWILLT